MLTERWIGIIGLLFCLTAIACKDDCKDKVCQNNGVCVEGTCQCPEGFTGPNCEIELDPCIQQKCVFADTCLINSQGEAFCLCTTGYQGTKCDSTWNEKYLGKFEVTEDCGVSVFFEVDIVSGPRFNEITIANFHNAADNNTTAKVVCQALTSTALNIPQQFMTFGEVNGLGGSVPNDPERFSLTYTIRNGSDTLACQAVFQLAQ